MGAEKSPHTGTGAYGFRLIPKGGPLPDLVPMSDGEEPVAVSWNRASSRFMLGHVGTEEIALGAERGSAVRIRRDPAEVVFDLPDELTPGALVHPLLSVPLSLLARWRGYVALHAGAFESNGAWAILGDRTAGKSSMLAALGERGVPIVSDDLLVVDDGCALAGPRCVDLRPDVSPRFASARSIGVVGGRLRYRLSTPPASSRTPLRGLFVLDWSDDGTEIAPIDMQGRLQMLYSQEYLPALGSAGRLMLPIVGLPAWRVRRPRAWEATDAVIDRLLEVANDQA
jgi:hypothetical protein